ncbi:MAG TPA: hypothetical protein VFR74_00015 [Jiangellales bacterium]|nr:hypothetical protein [Jiangellales bacterium]
MVTDGLGVLSAEVTRVSEQLRRLGHARLARPLDLALRPTPDPSLPTAPGNVTGVELEASYPSVADAAHALAQRLADLAADAERRTRLPVPRLGDHAVGDQVAVTGNDLVALARAGRLDADRLDLAVEMLRHLRLALP